jgi:Domain of unknown function (DUF4157)
MSDRLSTTAKKLQSLDSTLKVSPFQPRGFGVQKKIEESDPVSKAQLWENYAQVKQLSRQQANISAYTVPIQAKLTLGEPGDKYEREADTTASKVMQMPEPGLVNSNVTNSVQAQPIQRACTDCQEENKEESIQEVDGDQIQTKEEYGQIPELISIQRKVNSAEDSENGFNLENQLNGSKGGGSPLNDEVRGFMEPRFGTDFSGVRVHTGSDAVQMNGQLNAQAFAHGSDIYFGAGKSPGNNELTAHELTHVVQQTGAIQNKPDITSFQLNQIMRDASDEQTKNVSVSLASDKEAHGIGHSWIMIQKPDGSKDSYGFWPVKMNWLFYPTLGWAKGRVMHPDTANKPNAVFTKKTTLKGLEKGINYAESQSASSYHILAFNCSTFARTMFEKATGETPPSGGLAIDSPNELADEITQRNLDQGLTAMGEPLPKNIPPLAPRYSLPASSPPPPAIQHKKVNVSEGTRNSYLDVNAHELTHVTQIKEHVQRKSGEQDIQNEDKKRIKELKANYDKAIKDENWSEVALLLNAFNDTDIKVMLGKLTSLQHIAMYYAAPEWLSRVKEPIVKLHPDLEKKTAITDAQMTEIEKNVMGVTVALYANYDYGDATARQNNQAFLVESKRFAENEAAIGLSGDNITAGVPIPINEVSEVPIILQRIHRGLVDKWQQTKTLKKDSSDAISTEPPAFTQIRNLALFAHGESYGIGMDKRNNFGLKLSNVKTFVSGLKNTVTKDIRVQVFSCNTALGQKESPEWFEPTQGGRKGDDSFASALAVALGEDASVYGHTAAGPTTEMTSARIFGKDAGGGKGGVHIFDLLYDEAFIQSELTRLFPSATNPADLHDPLRHEMWKHYQNQMLDFKKDVKTGQIQSSPKQYGRGQHTLGQEQFVNINSAMSNLRKHWVDVWSKDSAKISRVKPPGKPKSIKKS